MVICTYRELYVSHSQLAYIRITTNETLVVLLNMDNEAADIRLEQVSSGSYRDLLPAGNCLEIDGSVLSMIAMPACGSRILLRSEIS